MNFANIWIVGFEGVLHDLGFRRYIYMAMKSEIKVGLLLIVAGVLIGHGVGLMISELTGKSVVDSSNIIGLGIGILGAVVYTMKQKK